MTARSSAIVFADRTFRIELFDLGKRLVSMENCGKEDDSVRELMLELYHETTQQQGRLNVAVLRKECEYSVLQETK